MASPNNPPRKRRAQGNRRGPGRGGPRKPMPSGPRTGPTNTSGDVKFVEIEGVISAVLAATMFRVKIQGDREVLATISGKMRKRFIKLVIGDRVKMEMSPYDTSKARITYRLG